MPTVTLFSADQFLAHHERYQRLQAFVQAGCAHCGKQYLYPESPDLDYNTGGGVPSPLCYACAAMTDKARLGTDGIGDWMWCQCGARAEEGIGMCGDCYDRYLAPYGDLPELTYCKFCQYAQQIAFKCGYPVSAHHCKGYWAQADDTDPNYITSQACVCCHTPPYTKPLAEVAR